MCFSKNESLMRRNGRVDSQKEKVERWTDFIETLNWHWIEKDYLAKEIVEERSWLFAGW